jgi:hypothetical protein
VHYYPIWAKPTHGVASSLVVGVWCCPWGCIKSFLPDGVLFGAEVSLKGFDDLDSAIDHYIAKKKPTVSRAEVPIFDLAACEDAFRKHRDRSD